MMSDTVIPLYSFLAMAQCASLALTSSTTSTEHSLLIILLLLSFYNDKKLYLIAYWQRNCASNHNMVVLLS